MNFLQRIAFQLHGRWPAGRAGGASSDDVLRRAGFRLPEKWTPRNVLAFAAFGLFCAALLDWKSGGFLGSLWRREHWFPVNLTALFVDQLSSPGSFFATLLVSASTPSFWYSLAYSLLVVVFGIRRIRRRRTPYVTAQTLTLMAVQVLFLFLLPQILLPWAGENEWIPFKVLDAFFPSIGFGQGREYWRAAGLVLPWPLLVQNIFSNPPLPAWIFLGLVQTLVGIPILVFLWGKGAFCGWICPVGALAETLGDDHRAKMPHGPESNRVNFAGQGVLLFAILLLALRVAGWSLFNAFEPVYRWVVDFFLAGVVGLGCLFWFSGRVWCRFFCPLAALMHHYARFTRFRIFADGKKCISCNACTSVCHQGIDVMGFAQKGLPMEDPQCVRCSACVLICPTDVLSLSKNPRFRARPTI